jgi:rod shape-determining protein MreD
VKNAVSLLLLALASEAVRLAVFARLPIHPDFLLGIVVLAALARHSPAGAVIGFCLGLLRDIIYGLPVGTEALPLAVAGWLVGSLGRSVYREALLTQMVVIFLAGLGKGAFGYLLLRGGEVSGLFTYLLRISFLSSLETALVVPLLLRAGQDLFGGGRLERMIVDRLRAYERKIFVKR